MDLYYKPQAKKQLRKLPKKERKKIIRKLEILSQSPTAGKNLKGELQGLKSIRSWPYRIIYSFENKKVIIFSIAHRQGVYKN